MKRIILITALILLLQTILWIVFMGISTAEVEPEWTGMDYLDWAADRGIPYLINYVNVSLLTLAVVFFYTILYIYLRDGAELLATTGYVFIPVYGLMNLLAYSIQISVVPEMAAGAIASGESIRLVSQLIQVNPGSLVGFINGLAYALLGIPSILFGILLYRRSKKLTGMFLSLNGVFCILGIAGYLMESQILASGVVIGGIVFPVALAMVLVEFRTGIREK